MSTKRKRIAKRVKPYARLKPQVMVKDPSPMYSERYGSITGIVIHATVSHNVKGNADLAAIGNVFHSREASAHVCTDADGTSARYVADAKKAWHCAAYNSSTLGIEQISMATESEKTWRGPFHREVVETARWVAHWSIKHKIAIRRGYIRGGKVYGVVTHKDLGAAGGGHTDPGPGYPMGWMIWLAKGFKTARLLTGQH